MVMVDITRADPTGLTPDDNPATAVPLSTNDKAIIVLGTKMFGSSGTGHLSFSDQLRKIGFTSNGHFGSTWRTPPSHGNTVIVGVQPIEVPEETLKALDRTVKEALADLIYRKLVIVQPQGSARLTPDQMRFVLNRGIR